MGADFKMNPAFAQAVLRSGALRAKLEEVVDEAARRYRSTVPVGEGDLRDSIFGQVALTSDGYVGRVGAKDFKAGWVEFGTVRRPPGKQSSWNAGRGRS